MPLYDFSCKDCDFSKEHYVHSHEDKKVCPECGSESYQAKVSKFAMNVEYSSVEDVMENKINPSVKETQERIGREALDQDTKTLDNIYGKDKVEKTFYQGND